MRSIATSLVSCTKTFTTTTTVILRGRFRNERKKRKSETDESVEKNYHIFRNNYLMERPRWEYNLEQKYHLIK